ncbi:MAG: hypothetical protein LW875_04630 [Proteobacteria bacterium]|jgi:hypothetical protein|nr:hypothetical protein [Pseudomonadota bacterium]
MSRQFAAVLVWLGIAALSRFLPHPPNATAIGAIALLGAFYLRPRWLSLFLPLAALFLTDLVLGFHNTMIWTYGAFALISWFSYRKKFSVKNLGVSSLAASSLFFVLSNFGVFVTGAYGYSWQGLVNCYTMAIPFFGTQVVGDLFYTSVIVGSYHFFFAREKALTA